MSVYISPAAVPDSRPKPERDLLRNRVSRFVRDIHEFERDPMTNRQLAEASLLPSPGGGGFPRIFAHELVLLKIPEAIAAHVCFPINMVACFTESPVVASLTLGTRGIFSKTPTLYVELVAGGKDPVSTTIRATSINGRQWLVPMLESGAVNVALLQTNLARHALCTRLFNMAVDTNLPITDPLRRGSIDRLCSDRHSIALDYVRRMARCDMPEVAALVRELSQKG